MISPQVHVDDMTEHEYDEPCAGCRKPATWMAQSTHSPRGCPGNARFICDTCKAFVVAYWEGILNPGGICDHCKKMIVGQVSDHLHFIAL